VSPLSAARAHRPEIAAAVHVAELRYLDGEVRSQLRLSPTTVADSATVVVRLNDSFHAAWRAQDAQLASKLGASLDRVLAAVKRAAPQAGQLQLDYDCPSANLQPWAATLRALSQAGVLRGWEVWTTSLVAHLRVEQFGALFRGLIAGHVLQLFDTGEHLDPKLLAELPGLLRRAGLPNERGPSSLTPRSPRTASSGKRSTASQANQASAAPGSSQAARTGATAQEASHDGSTTSHRRSAELHWTQLCLTIGSAGRRLRRRSAKRCRRFARPLAQHGGRAAAGRLRRLRPG
jgi:hypothetical protein